MANTHKPVLVKEVLQYLAPKSNENMIDGTVGEGGHAQLILEKTGPDGKMLGIDWDETQIENSKNNLAEFGGRAAVVEGSYKDIKEIATAAQFEEVQGILLDVGYSSWQIEGLRKGFSFSKDEALDMRYSMKNPLTVAEIINQWPEKELEKIIEEYGEEKFARQIAKKIAETREDKKIETTFELKEIIGQAIPGKFQHGGIHYATRTFQALRIAVNGELDNLEQALPKALDMLEPGGRLVVISFHSLEDRIVKNFFRDKAQQGSATILTKKPIEATEEETSQNPRSRSAKLRAIIKK